MKIAKLSNYNHVLVRNYVRFGGGREVRGQRLGSIEEMVKNFAKTAAIKCEKCLFEGEHMQTPLVPLCFNCCLVLIKQHI